jgi:hypothetical protein
MTDALTVLIMKLGSPNCVGWKGQQILEEGETCKLTELVEGRDITTGVDFLVPNKVALNTFPIEVIT